MKSFVLHLDQSVGTDQNGRCNGAYGLSSTDALTHSKSLRTSQVVENHVSHEQRVKKSTTCPSQTRKRFQIIIKFSLQSSPPSFNITIELPAVQYHTQNPYLRPSVLASSPFTQNIDSPPFKTAATIMVVTSRTDPRSDQRIAPFQIAPIEPDDLPPDFCKLTFLA